MTLNIGCCGLVAMDWEWGNHCVEVTKGGRGEMTVQSHPISSAASTAPAPLSLHSYTLLSFFLRLWASQVAPLPRQTLTHTHTHKLVMLSSALASPNGQKRFSSCPNLKEGTSLMNRTEQKEQGEIEWIAKHTENNPTLLLNSASEVWSLSLSLFLPLSLSLQLQHSFFF